MSSNPEPMIAMATIGLQPGDQETLSTSSPHPIVQVDIAQPCQPLPPEELALEQSSIYQNQPHWSAPGVSTPQYTTAPGHPPDAVTGFSVEKADLEPWK